MEQTSLIVIGMLNTDIIVSGLASFPKPNDPVYDGRLKIGPGGKPGNIARMAGTLTPSGSVAIIAKTAEDSFGLWRQPMDGLQKAGVNTDYVVVLKAGETELMPSVALVTVDKQGNNMCFIAPGITQEFSEADIDAATTLFEAAAKNNGIFALTLECPLPTARHAMAKAKNAGLRVALDPGGLVTGMDITELIAGQPYIIKPNEFETRMLTGVEITDFDSAAQAAQKLQQLGAQNVLITHGEYGGYLFGDGQSAHIGVPNVTDDDAKDSTGCGDQSMATLCVYLQAGKSLQEAAEAAILAGTLQFHNLGCQPISQAELDAQV